MRLKARASSASWSIIGCAWPILLGLPTCREQSKQSIKHSDEQQHDSPRVTADKPSASWLPFQTKVTPHKAIISKGQQLTQLWDTTCTTGDSRSTKSLDRLCPLLHHTSPIYAPWPAEDQLPGIENNSESKAQCFYIFLKAPKTPLEIRHCRYAECIRDINARYKTLQKMLVSPPVSIPKVSPLQDPLLLPEKRQLQTFAPFCLCWKPPFCMASVDLYLKSLALSTGTTKVWCYLSIIHTGTI